MAPRVSVQLIAFAGFAAWFVLAALLTLSHAGNSASTLVSCLICGETGSSDFLLNIGLFVPFGILLARAGHRAVNALIIGLVASATIEVLQWLFVNGRVASPGDLIANSAGALAGAFIWHKRTRLFAPDPQLRTRLIASWITILAVHMLAAFWTSLPWRANGEWYLQRTPAREWADNYSGRLLRAGLGTASSTEAMHDLPSDRISDTALVASAQAGSLYFTVHELPGEATPRLAYTARLVEGISGAEIAAFARRGDALLLRRSSNAVVLRFSTIGAVVRGAYADMQNDTVQLSMNLRNGDVSLASNARAISTSASAPSPLRGWSWLLPRHRDFTVRERRLADSLWLLLWILPLIWWTTQHRATSRVSTPASDRELH